MRASFGVSGVRTRLRPLLSHERVLRLSRLGFASTSSSRKKKTITKEDLLKQWNERYNWSSQLDIDTSDIERYHKKAIEDVTQTNMHPNDIVQPSPLPFESSEFANLIHLKGFHPLRSQRKDEKVIRKFFSDHNFDAGRIVFLTNGEGAQLGEAVIDMKDPEIAGEAVKALDGQILFSHPVMWKMLEYTKSANATLQEKREQLLDEIVEVPLSEGEETSESISAGSLFDESRKPSSLTSVSLRIRDLEPTLGRLDTQMVKRKEKLGDLRREENGDKVKQLHAIDRAIEDLQVSLKDAKRAQMNAVERVANTTDGRIFFNSIILEVSKVMRGEVSLDETAELLAEAVYKALVHSSGHPILKKALEDILHTEECKDVLKYLETKFDPKKTSDASVIEHEPSRFKELPEDFKAKVKEIKSDYTRGFVDEVCRASLEIQALQSEIDKHLDNQKVLFDQKSPVSPERATLSKLQTEDRQLRKQMVSRLTKLLPELREVDTEAVEEKWKVSLARVDSGVAKTPVWRFEPDFSSQDRVA